MHFILHIWKYDDASMVLSIETHQSFVSYREEQFDCHIFQTNQN